MLRQLICALVGHVDHGKTSILDFIRGSSVAKNEAGGITQCISCSKISKESFKRICKDLLKEKDIHIPGMLFLDTPGHAAFTNLRKRGGNLADIAILVIDINEGIMPQTTEVIDILKQSKTPFVVVANKIDRLSGWRANNKKNVLDDISSQAEGVRNSLDSKIYELVGKLYDFGFNAERFDRVSDYTKQVAIIPASAITGEGIPELLMVVAGLAQRFLEKNLEIEKETKATIIEVKEEKGLGHVIIAVLYGGKLKINDNIMIGGIDEVITTKIKGLFEQDEKGKIKTVKEVNTACAVKIYATGLKEAVSGMPIRSYSEKNKEQIAEEINQEIDEVLLDVDNEGVIVKADSIGSIEALIILLREKGISIKKASIGNITKKDLSEAKSDAEELNRVILGFNVKSDEEDKDVKVICEPVIYHLVEKYERWKDEQLRLKEAEELEGLVRPAKFMILPNCIFRQSNPAVVGIEVMGGLLRAGVDLIKVNGDKVGSLKSIQLEGENITEAGKDKQVAIALPDVVVGRQINEGDLFYVDIPEEHFRKLKKLKKYLKSDEIQVLKEFAEIKRKTNIVWGV